MVTIFLSAPRSFVNQYYKFLPYDAKLDVDQVEKRVLSLAGMYGPDSVLRHAEGSQVRIHLMRGMRMRDVRS